MRIIAGKLGGRTFESPKKHRTHPMSEKMRGALFNALGDITGLSILDAFAGSGALSFEAISRGAASATAVDIDKSAITSIVNSVKALSLHRQIKAIRANASSWSDNNPDISFDIVLADPPYDDLQPELLEKLALHTKSGGVIVYSLPPEIDFSLPLFSFHFLASKNYGDSQLVFYRRIA